MGFAQLEDREGVVELVIFPEAYARHAELLKTQMPLVVTGAHENESGQSKILAEDFISLANLTARSNEIIIRLDGQVFNESHIRKLETVLRRHRGELRSRVEVWLPELKTQVILELDPEFSIAPSEAFFEDLERQLGSNTLATLN